MKTENKIHTVNLQQDMNPDSPTFEQWFAWVRYTESHESGLTAERTKHLTVKKWQKQIQGIIDQTLAEGE